MQEFDDVDKAILNRIQSDFPITSRPYRTIAEDLSLSEGEVLKRVSRLKASGIIRRIGGNFTPEKLGFVSTLCTAKVPEDKISQFAEVVNRYPGVTHNYRRENTFNIWFTFIAPSMDEINTSLKQIAAETGVTDILNLPATRVFKIRAEFKV
ncbi:MAG: AsnC family transcriptional regulator [Desulfobacterales bacterium]|jgi:DNA-binding Lrp family transcriptional regulator|nr:AsnC family transcriptional regulator [Desulfobacterales bacterium]